MNARRRCRRCAAWVYTRKSGTLYAHPAWSSGGRYDGQPCEGGGEMPWPWEDEAEEADFGIGGKWSKAEHGRSWFPASNTITDVNNWYLCRKRETETSLQFGPMHYKTAIALAQYLNAMPELHHYHGHPLGDYSVWQEPAAAERAST